MRLVLVLTLLAVAVLASKKSVTPPTWPDQYYLYGSFNIPYFNLSQPTAMYYDGTNNRERVEYYNGMDTYIYRFDLNLTYEVVPRVDTMTCFGSSGPGNLVTLLPDLSEWTYMGTENHNGVEVNWWEDKVHDVNRTNHYKMYLTQDGQPVELHMKGYDFAFDSHPDIYIFTYTRYFPGFNQPGVFNAPSLCSSEEMLTNQGLTYRAGALLGQLGVMTPPSKKAEPRDEFDAFMLKHRKQYATREEYLKRRSIFAMHTKLIEEHNKRTDVTFTMGMNQFGDMTETELKAYVYPRPNVKHLDKVRPADRVHEARSPKNALPASVDWVDKGAVNPPKDQGICGSCWTFGTAGSVEGVWAVKTGQLLSLSEQQLVDCAWSPWSSNVSADLGCDGGFAAFALQWAIENGGWATEQTYPYLMQDHWCDAADQSSGVRVKGYVNVTEGEENLLDAVATVGPVAVAIDATYPFFTFYRGGVFFNPNCSSDIDSLDHEVLAVGYGSNGDNDYWLVKNSWSTHWGDGGYVYMSRNQDNNCGIATQATYPIV